MRYRRAGGFAVVGNRTPERCPRPHTGGRVTVRTKKRAPQTQRPVQPMDRAWTVEVRPARQLSILRARQAGTIPQAEARLLEPREGLAEGRQRAMNDGVLRTIHNEQQSHIVAACASCVGRACAVSALRTSMCSGPRPAAKPAAPARWRTAPPPTRRCEHHRVPRCPGRRRYGRCARSMRFEGLSLCLNVGPQA